MKRNGTALAVVLLLLAAFAVGAQSVGVPVEGKITQEGQPMANVQVVLTATDSGRAYKTKTDKNGVFSMVGVPRGDFNIEVVGQNGEKLFKRQTSIGNEQGGTSASAFLSIDVPKGGMPADVTGPKLTKEQIAKVEADNKKIAGLNSLIKDSQNAMQAQDWAKAESSLNQLIAAAPETSRWDFYMFLGEAQAKQSKFPDAAQSYDKGIKAAQQIVSGAVPANEKIAALTPASARAGMVRMLTGQANAYLKSQKQNEGIAALKKATEVDPGNALAAYNLCGVEYTAAKIDDAKAACNKYLQLEPDGPHAQEVKGFLSSMK